MRQGIVWGAHASDWIDLSTGINPHAYPLPPLAPEIWAHLPDRDAEAALTAEARRFWQVPDGAAIVAGTGHLGIDRALARARPAGARAYSGADLQ